jgi:hypothetical protein
MYKNDRLVGMIVISTFILACTGIVGQPAISANLYEAVNEKISRNAIRDGYVVE